MSRYSSAEQLFRDHANCAQSVLLPFTEGCGVEKATAMDIASGFGGGMARLQGTCGALTGACMALGIAIGAREPDPTMAKDATVLHSENARTASLSSTVRQHVVSCCMWTSIPKRAGQRMRKPGCARRSVLPASAMPPGSLTSF